MHYFPKSSVMMALQCIALLIYAYSFLKLWWIEELKLYFIKNLFEEKRNNSWDKNILVVLLNKKKIHFLNCKYMY